MRSGRKGRQPVRRRQCRQRARRHFQLLPAAPAGGAGQSGPTRSSLSRLLRVCMCMQHTFLPRRQIQHDVRIPRCWRSACVVVLPVPLHGLQLDGSAESNKFWWVAWQDKLRDEPLASLQLPILFVRGTRDQFCDDGPWEAVRPRLTSPDVTVHTVEGGDHGLKVKGGKVRC